MKKVLTFALCLLLCVALLNCAKKKEEAPKEAAPVAAVATANVVDTLMNDGRFTTFNKAVEAAGLVETLKGMGPFTVFAPTDSAFAKLPPGTVDGLLADVPTLKSLLLYHVVSGQMMAADLMKMTKLGSMAGDSIAVMVMPDGKVMLNNSANVIQADVAAKNGVVHVVDTVLIPPSMKAPAKAPAKAHAKAVKKAAAKHTIKKTK
jgi:uncharacterized surface protein with fasciclin (FAS1) repeats